MTDRASGAEAPLLVDVGGLPPRFDVPRTRGQRRLSWVNLVLGASWGVMALVGDDLHIAWLVLGGLYLVLGAAGLLALPRAHLLLEPDGVRHVGAVGRGRLTPWAQVAEVRPPSTWSTAAHLRHHGGRFAETTDLPGLSGEQAVELQRRLEAARAASLED